MDKVVFTDHALSQMKERGISQKLVKICVQKPDKISLQNLPRFRAIKKLRRLKKFYLLVIIFDQLEKEKHIVTVFYTSKTHKYL